MDLILKLSNYYSYLLNQISKYDPKKIGIYRKINIDKINSLELFEYIKQLISELIDVKISEALTNDENIDNYFQHENYTKKLEKDIKILNQKIFEYQIQINAYEDKIKIYKIIQQEHEKLKDKVKYYNGKFLDNERKNNEIIILRQENEIIKKDIEKFNKISKLNETMKYNYITKINKLKKEIENLNKKLESKSSINNNKSNYNASNVSSSNKNMSNHDNNLISKLIYQSDINEINNIISSSIVHKKKYDYLKGLKKIFQKKSIKNSKCENNFNITKSLYLNSNNNLKYNCNCSTVNTSGQNIFTINYNKICSTDKIKKIKKKTNKNN